MLKIILVDDEAKLREVLQMKLMKHCNDLEIVGQAKNIEEAKLLISEKSPDLIFLDIEMPGGTGIDLLNQLDRFSFEIIFVTGYNDYAIDALKLSAVDYLLKPVKTNELISAVEKARERLSQTNLIERYEILKSNLDTDNDQSTRIGIPNNEAYEFVKIEDIIRCEGWNKYTKVHLSSGKSLVSSYNIGIFKDMLEPYGFFATHKSHLINKVHMKRYLKDGSVIMVDDTHVPVARRRKDEFIQAFLSEKVIR